MRWWSCPHRAATARRKSNPGEKSRPPRSLSRLGTPSAMRLVPREGQQIPPSPVRQPAINFSLLSSLVLSVRSTRTVPWPWQTGVRRRGCPASAWQTRSVSPPRATNRGQPSIHHALVEGPHRGALYLSPPWRPFLVLLVFSLGRRFQVDPEAMGKPGDGFYIPKAELHGGMTTNRARKSRFLASVSARCGGGLRG